MSNEEFLSKLSSKTLTIIRKSCNEDLRELWTQKNKHNERNTDLINQVSMIVVITRSIQIARNDLCQSLMF